MEKHMENKEEKPIKPQKEKYIGKSLFELFIYIIKTFIKIAISFLAFSAVIFLISVAFPNNVQNALEIFLNFFNKIH